MQNAQKYLEIINDRGKRRLPLQRVYRNLQNRELFLLAYSKIYANKGATTPGTDESDSIDGMSMKRIDQMIEKLKAGAYKWKPVRRVNIPKKDGKLRSLGVPNWSDKLLQQVMQMVLTAYYEPQFSEHSHGFRPGRSCHTALREIVYHWKGTKWFIEGDIKGCFDNIDHKKLLEIIGRNIRDERLLRLLREMLDAGYLEDWKYNPTYSGTPQGGIISPLLANIFLNELDEYIEKELSPAWNKGTSRKADPEYVRLTNQIHKARSRKEYETAKALDRKRRRMPYGIPDDPEYRRLRYVRYADDFLIGFVGAKAEAEQIRERISQRLSEIGLTMSQEKTLITHATEEAAKFLGYDVSMGKQDNRMRRKRRTINGTPLLEVPDEVVRKWESKVSRNGKPYHRMELANQTDYTITATYGVEFQGLVNYYEMAHNVRRLNRVKYAYLMSLVKTLAVKHKTSAAQIMKKYLKKTKDGVTGIVVEVNGKDGRKRTATFGGKPIRFSKGRDDVSDKVTALYPARNELYKRLVGNVCELCGSREGINVHHIRKIAEIKQRYRGKNLPPKWALWMMMHNRKTIVVCKECHHSIHTGRYDGTALNGLLESRMI